MFVTLYGVNNIGKTTHARRLVERLRAEGYDAVYLKYPIYEQEPTGPFLNRILRSGEAQQLPEEELQLWFVLNRYQFQPKLKELLAQGKIVIAEDYCGTGIAWGVAKGAEKAELENMNKFLVQEEVAILMEGSRDTTAQEAQHIHEQNEELIQKTAAVLEQLAGERKWHRLKVADQPDETAARLWTLIEENVLPHCSKA